MVFVLKFGVFGVFAGFCFSFPFLERPSTIFSLGAVSVKEQEAKGSGNEPSEASPQSNKQKQR